MVLSAAFSYRIFLREVMAVATFITGDHVQTLTGERGELIAINSDGISGYVEIWTGDNRLIILRILLDNLTKVSDAPPRPFVPSS